MSIIIDSLEPQDKIWDVIASLDIDIPDFEFKRLPVADYLLENGNEKLLIERKALSDFCANYVELKDRMDVMRQTYDRTALLLEGNYTVQNGCVCLWRGHHLAPSMKHQAFHNFIASQQARGSYFYTTVDLKETIKLLCYLHEYLPEMGLNPSRKTKSAVEWIAQLPGVGLITAFGAKEQYSRPIDALEAYKSWLPKKAEKILNKW